ncbi:MAG: PAS domain S-box protein [Gammaproteobacteria bacterium]|nr:PAS domain S-box protein [Gammaproteobacteria bacterium]
MHKVFMLLLIAAVLLIMLVLDLNLPAGVIHGIPYVVLISVSYWLPWRRAPVVLAAVGTLLIVVGYLYSTQRIDTTDLLLNISLEAAVLWVTAYLVLRYRASSRSLEDREQRLRVLVGTAVDGVMIIDANGNVQEYNPACEQLFGYRSDEVIGQNVKMLMPPPYQEEHDEYLHRYRATGNKRIIGIGREVEGRRKDGTTFPMELSVGEARPGGQQVFVGIIRDITARKSAEQSLRIAKEQAESASHAKSQFLANISHEIRTPMNAVLGYTQLIENDPELPENYRRPLRAIHSAGNHLISLIDDVLDLSKIEAGAMELDARDFDLDDLTEAVSEMFAIRCEQKGLLWQADVRIGERAVHADDRKLRQILINLLGNSVKFTDQGQVGLMVEQSGRRYTFNVSDTGPGINKDAQQRIFEPFQQAEEGEAKGGTGLGLAITRRHIELMGGSLSLESTPGEGSCFRFELELPPAEGDLVLKSVQEGRLCRLAEPYQVQALVVDDLEDNREVLSGLLERAGIEVTMASNGAEALQLIAQQIPDIIFMDVRMPVMDGLTAVQQLRERWPAEGIVCVAITASGLLRQRSFYQDAGFDDFIGKPFLFEKVCNCMVRHLHVEFVYEPDTVMPASARPCAGEPGAIQLPGSMRERLLAAARINALTDIETLIGELKELSPDAKCLAVELEKLLSHYDMDGILALIEQIPAGVG